MDLNAKLAVYDELLHKWQKKINLVGPQTLNNSKTRHFDDSLQLLPFIKYAKNIVDLGSGAGFPGLVLAMAQPDMTMHLIESDKKKCSFLRTVSRETNTNVDVINERIEVVSMVEKIDIVTARALADLSLLFDYAEQFLKINPSVKYVFLKGRQHEDELQKLQTKWSFNVAKINSTIGEDGVILVFTNIQKCE